MNNERPDLNLLIVFNAVAGTGSVTAAAEQLSLSQPAVSHALNRLRAILHDPLFVRGKSGFMPTPRAEALAGRVREIVSAAQSVFEVEKFDPRKTTRRFCIGASDYSSLTLIPDLVREFRRLAPRATLDVASAGGESLAQLASGELDCTYWGSIQPETPWRGQNLFSEHLVGMIACSHPLAAKARRRSVTLDDYLSFPHAVVSLKDPRRNPVDAELARLGRAREIGLVSQSFSANMAALSGDDLIASLPSRLAPMAARHGLVRFDLPFELSSYSYWLVWHHRTDTDQAMSWFRELVIQCVQAAGRTGGARKSAPCVNSSKRGRPAR